MEYKIKRILYSGKTKYQSVEIIETESLGASLILDGKTQSAQVDEHVYHESLVYPAMLFHPNPRNVFIGGGGEGATLRRVLLNSDVDRVMMIDLDREVVDICRKYLPGHSQGAFDDPRLQLVIADGAEYVSKTKQRFDIIIVDSPDPLGPGTSLFSDTFYHDCHRCLIPGGVLVTQNGVPFVQAEELRKSANRLSNHFTDVAFFRASVPTYYGGDMTFGWATDDATLRTISISQLRTRFSQENLDTRYYSPEIHVAAFAIPPWIKKILKNE